MANNTTGFLKTVAVGGFDKKDVLAYVDDLNSKIYKLEADLQEAKEAQPAPVEGGVSSEEVEDLKRQIGDERVKANSLQAKVDTLNLNVQSYENEIAEKDTEIKTLKDKIADLEDQLASGSTKEADSSVDIGNIFIEAQKTAQKIIAEQRAQARKMEEESKQVAEQVIEEANVKAESIINEATNKATKSVADIEAQANAMISNAEFIKNSVKSEVDLIYTNISDLNEKIAAFAKESDQAISKAKNVIDGTDFSTDNSPVYEKFDEIRKSSNEVKSLLEDTVNPRQSSVEEVSEPEETAVVEQEPTTYPVAEEVEDDEPTTFPVAEEVEDDEPTTFPVAEEVEDDEPTTFPVAEEVEDDEPTAFPVADEVISEVVEVPVEEIIPEEINIPSEAPKAIIDDELQAAAQAVYEELSETEATDIEPETETIVAPVGDPIGVDDLAALLADVEKSALPQVKEEKQGVVINDNNVEPMSFDEMAQYAATLQSQIEDEAKRTRPHISEL